MAQQVAQSKERKPTALIQCNYCNHIWLARSSTPVLTCSACANHVIVRDTTITADAWKSNRLKEIQTLLITKMRGASQTKQPTRPNHRTRQPQQHPRPLQGSRGRR